MSAQNDHETPSERTDGSSRDGFAAMAVLALTVVFVVVVLVALI